jgi:uncharacterized repeat protein (TIGR02543 family)
MKKTITHWVILFSFIAGFLPVQSSGGSPPMFNQKNILLLEESEIQTGNEPGYAERVYEPGHVPQVASLRLQAGGMQQKAGLTFTVTNTLDSGPGSLRQAILDANATAGKDFIVFDIPGPGPHVINPASVFVSFTEPVVLDGRTQGGYSDVPLIVLDGSGLPAGTNALVFTGGAAGSEVYGLSVVGYARDGGLFGGLAMYFIGGNNIVQANYVGLLPDGTAKGNGYGIVLDGSNNQIGGTSPTQRNVVSANSSIGIDMFGASSNGNVVEGNYIGTDPTGTQARGNRFNVQLSGGAWDNIIGGTDPASRNIVSGGIYIDPISLEPTDGTGFSIAGNNTYLNRIIGNFIGTDVTGTQAIPNWRAGVLNVFGGGANNIGEVGAGNLISGNTNYGIYFQGTATNPVTNNSIVGNLIGTQIDGESPLPNQDGVFYLGDVRNAYLGGFTADRENTVAFNTRSGVFMVPHDTPDGLFLPSSCSVMNNSIHSNGMIGIGFGTTSIIENDADDADTGPNNLQNFPEISEVLFNEGTGQMEVTYHIPSLPGNSVYHLHVHFYATNPAERQGKTLLGEDLFLSTDFTNGGKTAIFTIPPGVNFAVGDQITSTATDGMRNTSQFGAVTVSDNAQVFHNLTVNVVGNGSVEVDGVLYTGVLEFEEGTNVSLEAFADTGWEFVGWSGDLVGTTNPESLLIDADKTVTATFEEIPPTLYELTVNVVGNGSVEVDGVLYTGVLEFEEGTNVSLEAFADTGWEFVGWSGDLSGTTNPETLLIDADKTVTATFEEISPTLYELTVNVVGNGSVEVDGLLYTGVLEFEEGTNVSLEAFADTGWEFVGWSGDLGGTTNPESLLIDADKTVTATFEEIPPTLYELTVNVVGNGSVEVDGVLYTGVLEFEEGTNVSLEAIADTGWEFTGWSGDLVGTTNPESLLIDADKTVTATFEEIPPTLYELTVNVVGNGSVEVDGVLYTGVLEFEEGTNVSLEALADLGWEFTGWSGDLAGTTNPESLLIDADKTVTATFEEIPPTLYELTVNVVGNGSVEVDGVLYTGVLQIEAGSTVSLEALADLGWEFVGWSGDLVGTTNPESLLIDADKTVTATFTEIPPTLYELTVNVVGNGSVEVDGVLYTGVLQIEAGSTVSLEALADLGWEFVGWSGDLVGTVNPETLLIDADKTVTATFEETDDTDPVLGECSFSQGYWFARPQTIWPHDVTIGGHTFTQEDGQAFWPSNTNTKRAFTQYATIVLSGVDLALFPGLAQAMAVIEDYFANVYPDPASRLVNQAAGYIGVWVDDNHCMEEDLYEDVFAAGEKADTNSATNIIRAVAYPNPFASQVNLSLILDEDSFVRVEVFNMIGNRIGLLHEGQLTGQNVHEMQFNAGDLPRGIYFFRIQAGDHIHMERVVRGR